MNILVTGYEGFLGSNLTKKLISSKANLIGLDIKTFRKNTLLTNNEYKRIKVIKGNISNFNQLISIINHNNINFIFHLAAEAIVGNCCNNPTKTFLTNIKGTWNILEASRQNKSVKGIIIASSDKAYGACSSLPYTESSPIAGIHPYDVSKSCADLISVTYWKTFGLPVCITRCGNIFGPGDYNFSRVIPDTISSLLRNKPIVLRSDGKFTRDYIYIDDIVDGYLKLANKMRKEKLAGEAFNFSNEKPYTVLEIVNKISLLIDRKPKIKILNIARNEIKYQYLSSKKACTILNWKPKTSIDKGLQLTINWYKKYHNK